MAGPTIDDIVAAIKGADERDLKKLKSALSSRGIDTDDPRRPSKLKSNVEEEIKQVAGKAADAAKKALEAIKGPIEDVRGPLSGLTEEFKDIRQQAELFAKAGLSPTIESTYSFKKALSEARDQSFKLTGNFKAQREATSAIMEGFQGAAFTAESFRKEIFKTATTLQAAGFDTSAYASIVDTATMSFNMSEDEIKGLTASLVELQKQFALNPRKMMQDYDYFAKNFAYSTTRLNENFAKLQKMSRITGVDFRKLTESFGENMDTFEGSAQMAGKLNQILGKSMFSSIDLLNKTEAERAEVIRKGIQDRFGGRIDQLKKFELKAIATQLKMSPDEARRFLRGEAPKAAKGLDALTAAQKDPAQIMSKIGGDLTKELGGLTETIRAFQTPYERGLIQASNALRQGIKDSDMFRGDMAKIMNSMSSTISIFAQKQKAGLGTGTMENTIKAIRSFGLGLGKEGGVFQQAATTMAAASQELKGALEKVVAKSVGGETKARLIGGALDLRSKEVNIIQSEASIDKQGDKLAASFYRALMEFKANPGAVAAMPEWLNSFVPGLNQGSQ